MAAVEGNFRVAQPGQTGRVGGWLRKGRKRFRRFRRAVQGEESFPLAEARLRG